LELIIIIRVLLAAVLGTIIGFERDVHGRDAGLRTHLLVCVGSALFMLISLLIYNDYQIGDPARIAAQIIAGIGFLGAGSIIKDGVTVKGLTTAAVLWCMAGIGMACGAGYYFLAIFITGVSLVGLLVFGKFERTYKKDHYKVLELTMSENGKLQHVVEYITEQTPYTILSYNCYFENNKFKLQFTVKIKETAKSDSNFENMVALKNNLKVEKISLINKN
jgi:putative Mg2+ transporter-C (MgtC) family protein